MINTLKRNKISFIVAGVYIVIALLAIFLIYDWRLMLWTLGGGLVSLVMMYITYMSAEITPNSGSLKPIIGIIVRIFLILGILVPALLLVDDSETVSVAISILAGLMANMIGIMLSIPINSRISSKKRKEDV